MRKLLKRQGMAPDEWVTDKNPAYGVAPEAFELALRDRPARPEKTERRAERGDMAVSQSA
jgi:putative transposase